MHVADVTVEFTGQRPRGVPASFMLDLRIAGCSAGDNDDDDCNAMVMIMSANYPRS